MMMFQDVPAEVSDLNPAAESTQEDIHPEGEASPLDPKKEEKKRKEEEKKRKEEEKKKEKEDKKRKEQEKKQAEKEAKSSAKSTPIKTQKTAKQPSPGVRPSRMVLCRVLLLDQTNFEVEIDVSTHSIGFTK